MKQKEKDDLESMYSHYGYTCFLHGKPASQRGHIIGDTKLNRKVHGNEVVDNVLNWLPCHDLQCNKSVDIGFIPLNQQKVVDIIKSDMDINEKRELIERLVKDGIMEVNR